MEKDSARRNDRGANNKAHLLADNLVSKILRAKGLIEPGRHTSRSRGSSSRLREILHVAPEAQNAGNTGLELRHKLYPVWCNDRTLVSSHRISDLKSSNAVTQLVNPYSRDC